MDLYRNILRAPAKEDYLKEAISIVNYINTRRVETEHGIYWSIHEDLDYDEICLYAGSTGIAHYFVSLYEATGDEVYLKDACRAAEYIIYRWKNDQDLDKNFSKWAFSTGYSGAAFFLIELYGITGNELYKNTVFEIGDRILATAIPAEDGVGYYWSSYPGIVGDAGTILFLLKAGEDLNRKDWVDFAVEAGRIYLNRVRNYPGGGRYYLGVNPAYFGGDEDYIDPNFPMGTAGIGFLLLRLYEVSGDEVFLKGIDGITDFMEAVALKDGDATLLPHGIPSSRPGVYYLGYCHGPVGTARFFYKCYEVTKDPKYKEWEQRLVNGLLRTGAPKIHSAGYWNNYSFCCGTAGMLNLFLGIWAANGEERFLNLARESAEELLGWSTHKKGKYGIEASWNQAFAFVDQSKISANIGLYDGAAGIGWTLLQLYQAEKGEFFASRAVDDPYPGKAIFQK